MLRDDSSPAPPTSPRTRMSAEERRASVVAAAVTEFAEHGYEGTATESIAVRAGVSQPYLFQLFGRQMIIQPMHFSSCIGEPVACCKSRNIGGR